MGWNPLASSTEGSRLEQVGETPLLSISGTQETRKQVPFLFLGTSVPGHKLDQTREDLASGIGQLRASTFLSPPHRPSPWVQIQLPLD